MKNLLTVITDMNQAEATMMYAARLAKDLNSNVHYLRALRPEVYDVGTHDTMATTVGYAQEQIKADLNATRESFKKFVSGMRDKIEDAPFMDYTVEIGQSPDIARDLIKENKADMILIDSEAHGYGLLLPETNMEIIRNIEKPVWVKPVEEEYRPFRHIVYGTDYNEEDISTLNQVVEIARKFNAKITAVHVTDDVSFDEKINSEGFKNIIRDKADYSDIDILAVKEEEGKNKQETLNDFASKAGADLIVLLKENRNFFERLFKQSSTRKLMHITDKALLVFHE